MTAERYYTHRHKRAHIILQCERVCVCHVECCVAQNKYSYNTKIHIFFLSFEERGKKRERVLFRQTTKNVKKKYQNIWDPPKKKNQKRLGIFLQQEASRSSV